MIRLLLFFIPVLTFLVPARWFGFYATLMMAVVAYMVLMLTLLSEQTAQALDSFGIDVVLGFIGLNLVLLAVRYWRIRRARARIVKLPAPAPKQ
jgi:small neutral amino acid transporter SnatA (MarC family)